jgi:hypothetical protein
MGIRGNSGQNGGMDKVMNIKEIVKIFFCLVYIENKFKTY